MSINFDDFICKWEKIENEESYSKEIETRKEKFDDSLYGQIIYRAEKRVPGWVIAFLLDNNDFIVAGNSLNRDKPNDFDVYPDESSDFDFDSIRENCESLKDRCHIICETKNSMTVSADGNILQFCKYKKDSLEDLIESFDFAHCQIGVHFCARETDTCGVDNPVCDDVYWTDDWLKSKAIESTYYTGSEYPLSSLIRLVKYHNRGMFAGNSYKYEMLKILNDIIERGYKDYDDFKDQMDSVDLMLLSEDNIGNIAWKLYNTLSHRGLVENKDLEKDGE